MTVRVANEADAAGVFAVSQTVHAENGTGTFHGGKVAARIERAIKGDNAICGVIGPSHAIEGAVILEVTQHWYSDDWCILERLLCVLPQYRRSTNAKDLLAFAMGCADTLKLPLFCGVTSKNRMEAKTVFYKKKLGEASGVVWIYTPNSEAV